MAAYIASAAQSNCSCGRNTPRQTRCIPYGRAQHAHGMLPLSTQLVKLTTSMIAAVLRKISGSAARPAVSAPKTSSLAITHAVELHESFPAKVHHA
eukprot:4231137-Karenia_brevis.AAC.1